MQQVHVGFALTGSFCTFKKAIATLKDLTDHGFSVQPIMSFNAASIDTRFGKAADFVDQIEDICGKKVIRTIADAEPIGPKKLLDVLVVCPCTGNTLAKLACGVADTPVTLAAKSHLRNLRPVVIAVSSNDSLAAAAKNIGELQNRKLFYFVPYRQDDPTAKPNSIVADFSLTEKTLLAALENKQLQPLLL